jgi:hypothetical protein
VPGQGGCCVVTRASDITPISFIIPGQLATVPCHCLLDTGATCSYVSHEFAHKHSLPLRACDRHTVRTAGGPAEIQRSIRVQLVLGTSTRSFEIEAFVLPPCPEPPIDVILGSDFLTQHSARIDFDRRKCVIGSRKMGRNQVVLRVPKPSIAPPLTLQCICDCVQALPDAASDSSFVISRAEALNELQKGASSFLMFVTPTPLDDRPLPTTCCTVLPDAASVPAAASPTSASPPSSSPSSDPSLPPCIAAVLQKHEGVFAPLSSLPPDRGVRHTIPLPPGHDPPYRAPYRMSPAELEEVKKVVADLLAKNYIEPAQSPYGSPILFVQKKDGTLRAVFDYRGLNKITARDRYPLPRIDSLFDAMYGCSVFSSLDLQSGYHQILIHPDDIPKTAFVTPLGQYQFKVLCFGLTNAPATFQRIMNRIFESQLYKSVVVYLDDVCVMSRSLEEHAVHLDETLSVLRDNQFFANKKKCYFARTSIKYLGHVVSGDGISVDPDKTAAVRNWPVPQNLQQLQSFLGLANYFRRFIQGYSSMVSPLTNLLGGAHKTFDFTNWPADGAALAAFNMVKAALTEPPVLALYNPNAQCEVRADASVNGTGAVLLQQDRPLAFMSKKFTPAQRNYTTTDQELLALLFACKEWRCYLEGAPHKVLLTTDHQPLVALSTKPDLSRRQARSVDALSCFDFEIRYQPGKTNVADPLSRAPMVLAVLTRAMAQRIPPPRPILLLPPPPVSVPPDPSTSRTPSSASSSVVSLPLPPPPPLASIKELLQLSYATDAKLRNPDFMSSLTLVDGLYKTHAGRFYVPDNARLRDAILYDAHDAPYAGHTGVDKTHDRVQRFFWWPNMKSDVHTYVTHCDACQRNKPRNHKAFGHLQPLPVPSRRFAVITMDLIVKLPSTSSVPVFDSILVIVDKFSKYTRLVPCRESMSAAAVADLLHTHWFSDFGMPDQIISDRGSHFNNHFLSSIFRILSIRHSLSTAYHPQTDGQTERTNRTLEAMLRQYVAPTQTDWHSHLPNVQFAINNSFNVATGSTPFFLVFGQHPATLGTLGLHSTQPGTRFSRVSPSEVPAATEVVSAWESAVRRARVCLQSAADRMSKYYNVDRFHPIFFPDQLVLLSTLHLSLALPGSSKFHPRFVGPFQVVARVGPSAVRLRLPPHWHRIHDVFHVSLLKHYKPGALLSVLPPTAALSPGGEGLELVPDKIIAHESKNGRERFLVTFLNSGPEFNQWCRKSKLKAFPLLLAQWFTSSQL